MIIANHLPVSSFTVPPESQSPRVQESKSPSDCSRSGPSRVPYFRRANFRVQNAECKPNKVVLAE
jgi:hypothetical protein